MPCGRIGSTELLVLALLLLVLFGGSRLPELGRGLGLGIRRFKKSLRDDDAGEAERKRVEKKDDEKE
jgi:sec-independent protein translocase protein TatA